MNHFEAILDFGCGCGRVIRQWKDLKGPALYGSDYNPRLVQWCQQNLPFAKFYTNCLEPPLPCDEQQFDFIYAISVFTHLPEDLQQEWLKDLIRVLKPDGFLIITLHGESRSNDLLPEQKHLFDSGQIVVRGEKYRGRNVCGAYHPESYVRKHLITNLTIIDVIPCGATDGGQDVYLLQKRRD
jgi:SAM-dependent methyltransferase